ncbi:MAG: FeoA family protein [Clostridiales bacterium]
MENIISRNKMIDPLKIKFKSDNKINLSEGQINREYIVKEIRTNDYELKKFLFSLGCYEGEQVTIISVLSDNYVIIIKDARYSIDKNLAEVIMV